MCLQTPVGNLGVKQVTGGFGEGIIPQASDLTFILILLTELSFPRPDRDPLEWQSTGEEEGKKLGSFQKAEKGMKYKALTSFQRGTRF